MRDATLIAKAHVRLIVAEVPVVRVLKAAVNLIPFSKAADMTRTEFRAAVPSSAFMRLRSF